jgi:hypothetical protein
MKDIRKVPASAGAEWLLGGFGLLRRSPLGLGLLGVIYGAIALLLPWSMSVNMTLFMALELALLVIGPLLIGGMVFAARVVDTDGQPMPAHLLQGVRDGKAARLLATLIPQVVAVLLCAFLLVLLVGSEGLNQMAQAVARMQEQAQPDPAMMAALPVGRLMLWMVLVLLIGVVTSFFTFVAIPEIMFSESSALDAMRRSFRACVRNLPALIVFVVLTLIAVVAVYIAVMIVAVFAKLIAGQQAMDVVAQLLATAILMPVLTGAMYQAWKQMLGSDRVDVATTQVSGFEA